MSFSVNTQKKIMLLLLSTILIVGFLVTSLLSFFVSLSYLRGQISTSSLPLTSDNIFSEIQRDIIKPIYISSAMAHNTFLRDWVIDGEKDLDKIQAFLQEVRVQYDTVSSFFVSEKTRNYYIGDGILKQVSPDEERDIWYFRVREMEGDYELNIDPDMANEDAMTIFINHRVYDYDGNFIGAIGVGLAMYSAMDIVRRYRDQFESNVYFVARDGTMVLYSDKEQVMHRSIFDEPGVKDFASEILANGDYAFSCGVNGKRIFVNSRFIPELDWFLLVSQSESETVAHVYKTLFINLALCAVIVFIVIVLTALVINAYQKTMQRQQDALLGSHRQLEQKNAELDKALSDVKRLSGLLPICSSCKKVRDDHGYWQQIEAYVQEHSDASFSHGICPECKTILYSDYLSSDEGE